MRRCSRLGAIVLLALAPWLGACSEGLTEIVLVVDTDLGVPGQTDRIRIRVDGPSDNEPLDTTVQLTEDDAPSLPLTLGLTPGGDELGPVRVVAEARRGGVVVVRQRRETRFVEGSRRMLRIVLRASCTGDPCPDEAQTCVDGDCRSVTIPGEDLPKWQGTPPMRDGGTGDGGVGGDGGDGGCTPTGDERCNGEDDDCDGAFDEGFDLGADPRNCGTCGNDCSTLAQVDDASCTDGACEIGSCQGSFADCDGDASNGCEADTQTDTSHCGGCDVACDFANASGACSGGSCELDSCDSGFGDCDADGSNGCETSLDTVEDCGRCDRICVSECNGGFCDDQVVVQISAGSSHSCAARQSGELACWGLNTMGRLGDGTTMTRPTPVSVLNVSSAAQVETGGQHTCARLMDGNLECWGSNVVGQIGDGTTDNRRLPTSVDMSGLGTVGDLSAGDAHTCAIEGAVGGVFCWGDNNSSQLGDDTRMDRHAPVAVQGSALSGDAVEIAAGSRHSCARLDSGQVTCWGANAEGQLGNGTNDPSRTADTTASMVMGATDLDAGGAQSCVVDTGGQVWCWGDNTFGQLGDGSTDSSNVPVMVAGLSDAESVSVGSGHVCALRSSGEIACWGRNNRGQLGDGTTDNARTRVTVAGLSDAAEVTCGNAHTCARRETGAVLCWGSNLTGQVGDGSTMHRNMPVPVVGLP